MEYFNDFLKKVKKSLDSNGDISLKNFVDTELSDLYTDVLTSMQYEDNYKMLQPSQLSDTLKRLKNPTFDKNLTLNFYFSHTYVLNLDRRPDRLEKMKKSLKQFGIYNWTRFYALDGRENPHHDEYNNYRRSRMTYLERRRYHRKAIGSPGSWAILKSMYLMIKDAMKKKYNSILVLQDDLLFHKRFFEKFQQIPNVVPKNWKMIYIGATQHNWAHTEFRQHYYFPMGTADGAFAVGIHHSVYQDMLDEIVKFEAPFDSGTLKNLQKKYGRQCLIMSPNLVIADIRDSDLRKTRDLNLHGKQFRWEIKDYIMT
jgi:GR25 family glycosyltransferase involved in LPS biosynthesis